MTFQEICGTINAYIIGTSVGFTYMYFLNKIFKCSEKTYKKRKYATALMCFFMYFNLMVLIYFVTYYIQFIK